MTGDAGGSDRELTRVLRADGLILTPLRVEDADELVAVLADPVLYQVIGGGPPTVEDLRRRYTAMVVGASPDGSERWLNWIVRDGETGRAVGTTQATVTRGGRRADVAWVIGVAFQQRGFGSRAARLMVEALFEAGVDVVTAHIAPGHAASEGVARACGLAPTESMHDGERRWQRTADSGGPVAAADG